MATSPVAEMTEMTASVAEMTAGDAGGKRVRCTNAVLQDLMQAQRALGYLEMEPDRRGLAQHHLAACIAYLQPDLQSDEVPVEPSLKRSSCSQETQTQRNTHAESGTQATPTGTDASSQVVVLQSTATTQSGSGPPVLGQRRTEENRR